MSESGLYIDMLLSSSKRDRHYYGIKDLEMAKAAGCGYMLWDGKSKGTLANIINLLIAEKNVLLYLSPKKQFFKLCGFQDLTKTLYAIGISDASRLNRLPSTFDAH